jgi:hypothetical protein
VKNLARLVLFFTVCFILVSVSAVLFSFFQARIDAARMIPPRAFSPLAECILASRRLLPLGVYLSLLLALSYTSRRRIPIPAAVLILFILGTGCTIALSLGLARLRDLGAPAAEAPAPLGDPGLILSQGDTVMVLLRGSADPDGPRVVSIPDRPLIYQESPRGPENTPLALPPIPFRRERAPLLSGILADVSLSARQLDRRLQDGLIPFAIYAASLVFLLVSLRFILDFSRWPLANLFLGALAFRGVLALESFVNTGEIQGFIASLAEHYVPRPLITPGIFCGLALLVILYTALIHLARGRRAMDGY